MATVLLWILAVANIPLIISLAFLWRKARRTEILLAEARSRIFPREYDRGTISQMVNALKEVSTISKKVQRLEWYLKQASLGSGNVERYMTFEEAQKFIDRLNSNSKFPLQN